MGIAGFLTYLKKTYIAKEPKQSDKIWLINYNHISSTNKKYDYLFLDYQSMFYTTYELFSCEINYFLRLLYYIKYEAQINRENILIIDSSYYLKILKYIIEKYFLYFTNIFRGENIIDFLPTDEDLIDVIVKKINFIFTFNFNDKIIINKLLAINVAEQTNDLSRNLIKDSFDYEEKMRRTHIFFDGIPSLSKIKEQMSRRIYGYVMSKIVDNIWENNISESEFSLNFINSKLLSSQPPSIGLNSEIVQEIKKILNKSYFINSIDYVNKYGEAEHQIMKYIKDNDKFKGSELIISSPDADLILLIFIKTTNNYKIDLLRQNVITEFRFNANDEPKEFKYIITDDKILSPFIREYDHIIIDNLITAMNLKLKNGNNNNQYITDISFLFLLLGDDFIPKIPSIDVYKIKDLLSIYKQLCKANVRFKIINISVLNTINFNNLKLFIKHFSLKEETWVSFAMDEKRFIDQNIKKLNYIKNIYFFNKMKLDEIDIFNFDKSYFIKENGLIINSENLLDFSLIKKKNKEAKPINNIQIQNYLQGYSFILDVYINDNLKNYKWIYNYEKAPTLGQINNFLEDKNDECVLRELFDYAKNSNNTYLDSNTYIKFTNDNRNQIIINLLEKIIIKKYNFQDLEKLHSMSNTDEKINCLCKKYFIYDEQILDILFNCDGERYISKCLDIENYLPISLDSKYEIQIDKSLLGGYYQKKYLKYKNKYISLKNNIKII